MGKHLLIKPDITFEKEIQEFREEVLRIDNHVDGAGPLNQMTEIKEWLEFNRLEVSKNTILERLEERVPSLKARGAERVDEILESFKKIPTSEKVNNTMLQKKIP